MKPIRELLELPEKWRGDMEEAPIQDYDFGWNNCAQNCANQLQSAIEAADIQSLVDRVERTEELECDKAFLEAEITRLTGLLEDWKEQHIGLNNLSLKAQLEAQQWQPIESAPKDGTAILCNTGLVDGCWQYVTAHYLNDRWMVCCSSRTVYPAHWMPLPSPPQEQNDES